MNTFEQQLSKARQLFEQEQLSEASTAYLHALQQNPPRAQKAIIWSELSWVFYKMQAYDRAIEAAENTLEMDPDYEAKEDVLRILGFSYIASGRSEQAISYLQQSLSVDRSSAKQQMVLFELLKIRFKQQEYARAEELIAEVEPYLYQHDRDYWLSLLFYKGFVYYYQERPDEAEQVFEDLLENAKDDRRKAAGMYGLAYIRFAKGDYLKTINLCEAVIAADPGFFDKETIGFLTAASFRHLGRDDVFEQYYRQLIKTYPEGRYRNELDALHQGQKKGQSAN